MYRFIISSCWVVRTGSYLCISSIERELSFCVNLGGMYIKQSISDFIFGFSVKSCVKAHNLKVLRVTQRKLTVNCRFRSISAARITHSLFLTSYSDSA